MNLAAFSINRNRITFTVLGTIMIMGMVFYQSLSRDSMPPYTVRVATVVASFPGSSPERVEQLVTDKVEKTVQEIPELKEVSSTSRSGLSVVTVELKDQVKPEDLQAVWDRLRRKLSQLKGLPSGVVPVLNDDGIGEVFGIAVGLVIDGFSNSEAKEYIDDIKDDLIKLDLASKVELSGVQDDRIFIEFDNARLKEYNLSASKLQSIISTTNILSSGGQVNLGNERIILEPTGNFNSLSDIKQTLIPVGNGSQLVYLGDITRITQDYIDPPKQLVTVNGQQAISMHISLKEGANIIQLGEDIDVVLNKWQSILPVGLELNRLSSLDTYIDNKINAFVVNLLQSISIVLLVMLIFLGFRTGGIIASLIPMVTIMTIMLMGLINMGLNQVTLAALIMALGMMVDNAIVVAETIMVKMENGVEAKKAAIDACGELFTPLLISTLTTSAAFLAFYMAESTMGDIVGPIFIVITLALLSSWILALTVITLLCFMFLKVTPKAEKKQTAIDKSIYYLKLQYKNIILKALYYKNIVLLGIVVLFVLSLFGFGKIPFIFFPDSDRNMVTVDINLPQGSRIEATEKVIKGIETFISKSLLVNEERQNGISDWSSFIGSGPESYDLGYTTDEPDPSYAHILINTTNFIYNSGVVEKLDTFCFNNFPNADIKVGLLGSGGGGTPIEIKISGTNPDILAELSEQTKQKLKTIQGTKNIKDDWGPKTKKFVVNINQNKAQIAGVTSADIATSLQTVLSGFKTGEYRENDKSIPIIMRSDDSQQQTLASIETLNIYAQNTGRSVPLLQVASIEPEWQYSKIRRLNIDRTINVTSELSNSGNASDIMSQITPHLIEVAKKWPKGYTYKFGGDAENTADNMGAVISYLPLSGFIIILLLIIQFNSVRKTFMVASTIPLGIIGVVIGLLIFQEPFGFMPFLGVISLSGIVINNAIVLIDRIQIEEGERPIEDAIIAACLQRFRPILLATFTTVLGLIPLYLSGGEMWEGMAVSIMIGLLFGTVITLLFIPLLYSTLFKINYADYKFNEQILND